jgi:hypothetical protein
MSDNWLARRSWQFVADMNGNGAVTIRDVWPWMNWLFFLPGDWLILVVGPTAVGRFLELGPGSMGGPVSAGISFLVWWFGFWMTVHLLFWVLDLVVNIRTRITQAALRIGMLLGDRKYRKSVAIDWRGERCRAREERYAREREALAEAGRKRRSRWIIPIIVAVIVALAGLVSWWWMV